MKICPGCSIEHKKDGIYCSRACANARVWSLEANAKRSESAKRQWRAGTYDKPEWRALRSRPTGRPAWNRGLTAKDDVRVAKQGHPGRSQPPSAGSWKKGDGVASRLRRTQLVHEAEQAGALITEGYEVFSPTVVCDRVAIKDGRVYFVEFKRPGQTLRDGQRRVQELVPDSYLVRFAEYVAL